MDTAKKDAKIIAGLKLTVDLANIFLYREKKDKKISSESYNR